VMYNLFTRHHIRPGEFWNMPQGEQLMLMAFSDFEIEGWNKEPKKMSKNRRQRNTKG